MHDWDSFGHILVFWLQREIYPKVERIKFSKRRLLLKKTSGKTNDALRAAQKLKFMKKQQNNDEKLLL